MDPQLKAMLDREAIRALPVAYAHYIWSGNMEGVVSLFTADGGFSGPENMGHASGARGAEALRKLYRSVTSDPRPFVHNHHIEMLGEDRAKGYVYIELRHGSENYRVTNIGVYEDLYVKDDGVWKFQDRRLTATPIPK